MAVLVAVPTTVAVAGSGVSVMKRTPLPAITVAIVGFTVEPKAILNAVFVGVPIGVAVLVGVIVAKNTP
jgi:hypothetical protein